MAIQNLSEVRVRKIDRFLKKWKKGIVNLAESTAIFCSTELIESQIPDQLPHPLLAFDDTDGNLSQSKIEGLCRAFPHIGSLTKELCDGTENVFTSEQAKEAVTFVTELKASVRILYCCCDFGQSRSAALAAALMTGMGRDPQEIWYDGRFFPNSLVYLIMCEALGVRVTAEELHELYERNREAAYEET